MFNKMFNKKSISLDVFLILLVISQYVFSASVPDNEIVKSRDYKTLIEKSSLIIIGKVEIEKKISLFDINNFDLSKTGDIIPVKVEKKIYGEDNSDVINLIFFPWNPILPDTYNYKLLCSKNSRILFFLIDYRENPFIDFKTLFQIKDLSDGKYYSYYNGGYIFDLSIKENEEFAKNIEELINVLQMKNIDLKIEKLSEMLKYPERFNEEYIVEYIAHLHSTSTFSVLKKYLKENSLNKEKNYIINTIISEMTQVQSREIVDIAMEMLKDEECEALGKKMLENIFRYSNHKIKEYLYNNIRDSKLFKIKEIVLGIISKQKEIHNLEIEYLKEILLDINETTENRLLAAELISKVKDKDLLNRTIEILELVRYDKDENIAKKAVEYIKSLKEVNELK